MAERMFSIDFGSAFTKIALRRDPTAHTTLIACDVAEYDFWIPSLVAVDRRGAEPRIEIGEVAAGIKPGGGIAVFHNFKQDLLPFRPPASEDSRLPALDALLQSEEFGTLAVKYAVAPAQVAALRQLAVAARSLAGANQTAPTTAVQHQENAFKVAYHFFRALRRHVLASCAKFPATGLKYEDIPVRIAVPAFPSVIDVSEHRGCKLLREALHRAGWPLHPERPLVTEPESNAVGILTNAVNLLSRAGRINLGEMFNKGPLITVLKGDEHHPSYRALVMDVGAYTTDFASVSVETGGKNIAPATGAGFVIQQESVPLGVSVLEGALAVVLPKEKQEWLNSASRKDFSAVLRNIYSSGKGFRVPGGMVIGGEADREATHTWLSDFAQRLIGALAQFTQQLGPVSMQELILTGGGSNIPSVRDALINAAQASCGTFAKIHAPDLKRGQTGSPPVGKLDESFARGGSALGGASIYFEREYY